MEYREVNVKFWVPKPSRRWLQFSMRSLLILSLIAGAGLGWWGMRIKHAREESREWSRIYVRVYNVADLIMPSRGGNSPTNYDVLINEIKSTIAPDSWEDVGGRGAIAPFETNLSLVVSQREEAHKEVGRSLESKLGRPVNDFRPKTGRHLQR